jgi:trigger factor
MKKNYRILAALALSVAMLSACGSDNTDTASTETTQEAVAETTTEAAAETTTSDAAGAEASADAADTSFDISGLATKSLQDVEVDKLVTLGEYKGIALTATKTAVSDEDVENNLKNTFQQHPRMVEVTDRAVASGDTVNIDFVGKFADTKEAFEGGASGEGGYDLVIGSGSFIDGFEDGLIGAKLGETRDLNLKFPDDYGAADLAGKDVIFTVTVNKITVADAEPSDEWVKGLGLEDVENMDQFRAHLRAELEADADAQYSEDIKNAAVEIAAENATVGEIPQELVNRYYVQIVQSLRNYIQQLYYAYGFQVTEKEYVNTMIQSNGLTVTPEEYITDLANQQATRCLVLQAIANKEGIDVPQETVDKYIQEDYDNYYNVSYSTIEEYKATFDSEDYREQIMAEQVADFLVENATVTESAQ